MNPQQQQELRMDLLREIEKERYYTGDLLPGYINNDATVTKLRSVTALKVFALLDRPKAFFKAEGRRLR